MNEEIATLGGGCFWCLEAVYKDLRGVRSVMSGYAGGHVANPSYKAVCSGHDRPRRGGAGRVRSGTRWRTPTCCGCSSPSTTRRRRTGRGTTSGRNTARSSSPTRTRSAHTARAVIKEIADAKVWPTPIVTQVEPLEVFYEAEPEHHDYFARNPWTGYCQAVVAPKVAKFRKTFSDRLKREAAE